MKLLMCILIPPVGVAMKGRTGGTLILNIALTLFGFVPGMIHALIIDTKQNNTTVIINNK